MLLGAVVAGATALAPFAEPSAPAPGRAFRAALEAAASHDPAIGDFYAARDLAPLWVDGRQLRPEADDVLRMVSRAEEDGLRPERYRPDELRAALTAARTGEPAALARAEFELSRAMSAYLVDLRRPEGEAAPRFADPALARVGPEEILAGAQRAASLADYLGTARRMHPIYEGLRTQLALARRDPNIDEDTRRRLLLNLHRARMLPADPAAKYVLVDVAAGRLWLYEAGRPADSMRVVVGGTRQQTPTLAGLIRYAVLEPYWNLPHDMVRDQIAPAVLRSGPAVLTAQRVEALSDWSAGARVLHPSEIDWAAVADGRQRLRVRQQPGPGNMMGAVKFMLPNRLGIYLHDTPHRDAFEEERRLFSSGCVRVEDAARLARWLFGSATIEAAYPDQRVDLPRPVPVYMVYLTAMPGPAGVEFREDVYGRDRR